MEEGARECGHRRHGSRTEKKDFMHFNIFVTNIRKVIEYDETIK
jgi:hypothetical protein